MIAKDLFKTKKSKKSEEKKALQVPIKDIKDLVQTTDGKYKIIGKVSPINAELLSDDDLESVYECIYAGLNTFSGKIGIYVQSERIDIEENILNIEKHKETLNSELKVELLESNKNYLEKLRTKSRNVLNFYIVLESDNKKYPVAEQLLTESLRNLSSELSNENMFVERLYEKDIKELLYNRMNKESSLAEPFLDHWGLYEIFPKQYKRYKDGKHIEVDGRMYRHLYISSYPQEVNEFRWLKKIFRVSGDVNIAITMTPKDRNKINKSLSNAVSEYRRKSRDTSLQEHEKIEAKNKEESAIKLIENLSNDDNNLYDVNITIGFSETDIEKLNILDNKVRASINASFCQASEIRYKEFDPFFVTLPILYDCKITRDYVWNFTSSDIASLIIFDSAELMESKGTLVGENVSSKGLIIVDMHNRKKYNNGHMAVVAETGAGKTFYLMLDAIRNYPYVDYIIMFDIKGDFYFPWGKRYVFNPAYNTITNPFHIRLFNNVSSKDIPGILANKIMDLIIFFKWIIKDMNAFQEALIEEDIRDAYKRKGISFDSESLHNDYPTLDTLEEVMLEKIENRDNKYSDMEVENRKYIRASLNPYINGAYSKMFNGKTNWNYDPFTVFDISSVSKAVQNPLYELLLKDTWAFCKKDGTNNPEKKRVYVDEAHVFADPKNPMTLEFISTEIIKQGRGFGVDLITATQNIQDYLSIERYGQAIIDNSYFKTFFTLGVNDRPIVQELFGFSEKEMKILKANPRGNNKGRGIFINGSQSVELQVRASKDELEIIDPKQFEELYKKPSKYRRTI